MAYVRTVATLQREMTYILWMVAPIIHIVKTVLQSVMIVRGILPKPAAMIVEIIARNARMSIHIVESARLGPAVIIALLLTMKFIVIIATTIAVIVVVQQ